MYLLTNIATKQKYNLHILKGFGMSRIMLFRPETNWIQILLFLKPGSGKFNRIQNFSSHILTHFAGAHHIFKVAAWPRNSLPSVLAIFFRHCLSTLWLSLPFTYWLALLRFTTYSKSLHLTASCSLFLCKPTFGGIDILCFVCLCLSI